MATRFLMDTSAVIRYLNQAFPKKGISYMNERVDEESIISFITEIELQAWNPT
jgi:hypothetical protein